jgi:hypothetical protein
MVVVVVGCGCVGVWGGGGTSDIPPRSFLTVCTSVFRDTSEASLRRPTSSAYHKQRNTSGNVIVRVQQCMEDTTCGEQSVDGQRHGCFGVGTM